MKCTRITVLNLFLLSAIINGASATNGKDSRHLRGISDERSGEPGGQVAKTRSVAQRILEVVAVFPGNTPTKDEDNSFQSSSSGNGNAGTSNLESESKGKESLEVVAVFPGNTPIEDEDHSFQWSSTGNGNDGTSNLQIESEGKESLAGGSHGNDNAAFGKGLASSGSFSMSPAAKNANTGESVGSDVTEAEKSSLVAIASGSTASLTSGKEPEGFSALNWMTAFKSESQSENSFGRMHSNQYRGGWGI